MLKLAVPFCENITIQKEALKRADSAKIKQKWLSQNTKLLEKKLARSSLYRLMIERVRFCYPYCIFLSMAKASTLSNLYLPEKSPEYRQVTLEISVYVPIFAE